MLDSPEPMLDHWESDHESKSRIVVKYKALALGVQAPVYASGGSSGADVRAFLSEPIVVKPGERVLVPTGLQVEIPIDYEMQVRSRSGLAIKHGLFVVNSPGTIDSDYRGEIKIILCNIGPEPITIQPGERIAQFVIAPVVKVELMAAVELSESDGGVGGFGSSGR